MSRLLTLSALLILVAGGRADAPLTMIGVPNPPEAIARFGVPGRNWNQFTSVGAHTPSGAFRVAVVEGKEVRVWSWQPAHERRPVYQLTGHAADVQLLAMSPDARFLASADKTGEVRLWELVTGESTILKKPGEAVNALAVGPGGRRVAVAAGTLVGLHDLSADRHIRLGKHERPVTALAFAPTGGRLATATAHGRLTIWTADGTKVADLDYDSIPEPKEAGVPIAPPIKAEPGALAATARNVIDFDRGVRKLVFAPDGSRLAACGGTVVRMWDLKDRRVLWQHNRHALMTLGNLGIATGAMPIEPSGPRQLGGVYDIAFTRDGFFLASAGPNGDLRVTDAGHGEDVREPRPWARHYESGAKFDSWTGLAFGPDGRSLTRFAGVRKMVRERIRSGEQLDLTGGHEYCLNGLAVSPDGRYLATFGGDAQIRLWRLSTGECLSETMYGSTSFGEPKGMAFSPDGKWLVTGGAYHGFGIFKVVGDPPRLVMKDNYDHHRFTGHAFLPGHDARLYGSVRDYGSTRTLDLPDRTERGPGFVTSNDVKDLAVSPDGKHVAVAYGYSSSAVPDLIDAATGKRAATLVQPPWHWANHSAVEFSPDGRLLAGLGRAGGTLWDVATGKVYLQLGKRTDRPWLSMRFSPDGRALAVGGPGYIELYEVASGRILRTWSDIPGAMAIRFLKSGLLLSGGADGAAYLWDARRELAAAAPVPKELGRGLTAEGLTGSWSKRYPLPYRSGGIAFSPDGKTLAAGSWGKVHLIDLATNKETVVPTADNYAVRCLTFNRDVNALAASTYHFDGKVRPVQVYDLPGGKERWRSGPTTNFADALAFSRDEKVLYAPGREIVHRWDAVTGEVLDPIKMRGLTGCALAVSPDGKRMLVCGWSTTVTLLDLPEGRVSRQLAASDDPSNSDFVNGIAFHPTDGTALTVSREGVLRRWDPATGKRLAEWTVAPGATDVAISPKGDFIALSGDPNNGGMGRVDVWEVATGKERLRLNANGRVAWSPDGRWLATGDTGSHDQKDRYVLLWDLGMMLQK